MPVVDDARLVCKFEAARGAKHGAMVTYTLPHTRPKGEIPPRRKLRRGLTQMTYSPQQTKIAGAQALPQVLDLLVLLALLVGFVEGRQRPLLLLRHLAGLLLVPWLLVQVVQEAY